MYIDMYCLDEYSTDAPIFLHLHAAKSVQPKYRNVHILHYKLLQSVQFNFYIEIAITRKNAYFIVKAV